MFRRAFLLATTLFAVTACTTKAPDTSADVAKLKAIEVQWFAMYNKGEADSVASLYADDAIVLAPGVSAAVGKAGIKAFLTNDIAGTKAAGLTDNGGEINGSGVSGDLGWVSGAYSLTNAAGATVDHGKYTTVFQRMNGEWKIIRDTWNSDVAPASAAPASPAPASPAPAPPKPKA